MTRFKESRSRSQIRRRCPPLKHASKCCYMTIALKELETRRLQVANKHKNDGKFLKQSRGLDEEMKLSKTSKKQRNRLRICLNETNNGKLETILTESPVTNSEYLIFEETIAFTNSSIKVITPRANVLSSHLN